MLGDTIPSIHCTDVMLVENRSIRVPRKQLNICYLDLYILPHSVCYVYVRTNTCRNLNV